MLKRKAKSARVKRTKSPGLPELTKKLDREFSRYVRLRDSDENGSCACVTCGRLMNWKESHAGHFIKRQHMSVRWDEQNVHAQCPADNVYKGGCQDEYASYVLKTYGREAFDRLMNGKRQAKKWTRAELMELIDKYKTAACELESRLFV